jgi:hypothetical protein
MARISGKSTDIYIDTSQFETFTNSFTFNVNSNLPNVTTFGDEGSTFVQGKPNADFTLNSFFSPTDNESDEIINSALTGTSEVMIAPSGLTIGNNAYEVKANLTSEGIGTLSAGSTKTATLRVTAVSGSGTATIKIQDSSSSGSGYGDFLAFAQISGVGVQSVQTTDACERYLQINVTQYSGFTNFNCMVSMGVEVGTY